LTDAQCHKAICNYLPSASYPQSPQIFGGKVSRQPRVSE